MNKVTIKHWTNKEIHTCSTAYSEIGMKAAIKATGRSEYAIKHRMKELSVKCAGDKSRSLVPKKRCWFAEDVADIFEMINCGLKYSIIAEAYNSSASVIGNIVSRARKHGFDAYPMRVVK